MTLTRTMARHPAVATALAVLLVLVVTLATGLMIALIEERAAAHQEAMVSATSRAELAIERLIENETPLLHGLAASTAFDRATGCNLELKPSASLRNGRTGAT